MQSPFESRKYLKTQREAIEERLAKFEDRLYLEFGGKFIDDFHAMRTLPGYDANNKLQLLLSLKKRSWCNLLCFCKTISSRENKRRFRSGV